MKNKILPYILTGLAGLIISCSPFLKKKVDYNESKKQKINNLKIISGVGVRKYYEKLGYKLDLEEKGEYMVKNIK